MYEIRINSTKYFWRCLEPSEYLDPGSSFHRGNKRQDLEQLKVGARPKNIQLVTAEVLTQLGSPLHLPVPMKTTSVLLFPCSIPLQCSGMEKSKLACPTLLRFFWIRGWSSSAAGFPSHKLHSSSSLHAYTQLALLMIMCSTVSLPGMAYVNTPLTLLIRDRLLAASPGDEQMLSYAFYFRRSDFQMKSIPNISDFSN